MPPRADADAKFAEDLQRLMVAAPADFQSRKISIASSDIRALETMWEKVYRGSFKVKVRNFKSLFFQSKRI